MGKDHLTYSELYNVIHICQTSDSHGYAVRKMFYYFLLTVVQDAPYAYSTKTFSSSFKTSSLYKDFVLLRCHYLTIKCILFCNWDTLEVDLFQVHTGLCIHNDQSLTELQECLLQQVPTRIFQGLWWRRIEMVIANCYTVIWEMM